MGSHSLVLLSLPLRPLLCAPSAETETRRATPRWKMVLHSGELADGKKRALNWWAVELAPGWSFLLLRWAGDGLRRRGTSCPNSPEHVLEVIPLLRKRAEQAWRLRWGSMLSCTAARAVAASLLELLGARGADGATPPPHKVERDFRFAGLA